MEAVFIHSERFSKDWEGHISAVSVFRGKVYTSQSRCSISFSFCGFRAPNPNTDIHCFHGSLRNSKHLWNKRGRHVSWVRSFGEFESQKHEHLNKALVGKRSQSMKTSHWAFWVSERLRDGEEGKKCSRWSWFICPLLFRRHTNRAPVVLLGSCNKSQKSTNIPHTWGTLRNRGK